MTTRTESRTLLRVTAGCGGHRFYVDGRRTTRARHDKLRDGADALDSMRTLNRRGAWFHYAHARVSGATARI